MIDVFWGFIYALSRWMSNVQVQLTREITRSQLEIRLMLVSAPGTDIPRNQFVAWPLNNALVI